MEDDTKLQVEGDENEVSRIKLLVLLTSKSEVVEAILWGPFEKYLSTYKPERFEEMERKIQSGKYSSHDIRELLLQRVGAAMSIGANEVNQRYSLATPCLTYIYRKLTDFAEILPNPHARGKLIGRRLEYILLDKLQRQ